MSNFLFSYGLLLPGFETPVRALLEQYAEVGPKASLQAKLYNCGSYPAAVPSTNPADRVYGQLYKIALDAQTALFASLDRYEGDEYSRELLSVQIMPTGKVEEAWVYVYRHSTALLPVIESGDFLKSFKLI